MSEHTAEAVAVDEAPVAEAEPTIEEQLARANEALRVTAERNNAVCQRDEAIKHADELTLALNASRRREKELAKHLRALRCLIMGAAYVSEDATKNGLFAMVSDSTQVVALPED